MPAHLSAKAFYNTLRNSIYLLFFICIHNNLFAQQNKPVYNLLWRISGKGLKQPSYLFGTMHVKDPRAFHFSDSVMLAIKKTDAFTMEVHPDTIMQQMFAALTGNDTTRNLHKILNQEEYDKLSKRFKDRNGYEMGDADPMFVESMMTDMKKTVDDKPTFVDAYLYGIARGMSKKIYGLEKAADQFNSLFGTTKDDMKDRLLSLLDVDDKTSREKQSDMVDIYRTGNVDGIVDFLGDEALEDEELVKRNHVMAKGILAQLAVQPGFTAVGVAHLPGENGVIALLKQAGYTVTAVPATFTGVADTYHIDYTKMPWQTFTDAGLGYSMDLPGTPVKATAIKGLQTEVCIDLPSGATFGAYAFVKGTSANPAKLADVVNAMIENYKTNKQDQIISRKTIVVNGLTCTDVVVKNRSGYTRMNIYVQNNILYCLYVGGGALQNLNLPYVTHFLNSFKCFKPAPKAAQQWLEFKNDVAAFSAQWPAKPQPMEKESPNTIEKDGEPIKLHIFYATDTVNLVNYIARYNDYPSGSYLSDKQTFFESIEKEMVGKNKIISPAHVIWKDGIEGRELKAVLMGKYFTTVQVFVRGNRIYMLMRQSLADGVTKQADDGFFSGFKFMPFLPATAQNFEPEDQYFKIQLPGTPKIINTTSKYKSYLTKSVSTYSTNAYSGGVYGFEYSLIGPYYRSAGIDSMYHNLVKGLVQYTDTLLKVDTVLISGHKALEYITQRKGTTDKTRNRLFIDKGAIYFLTGHIGNEELFNETSNAFFNSLVLKPGAPDFDLQSSKAEKIKEAMFSVDTAIYQRGLGALNYYDFNKDELPVVYAALKHQYPDDTSAYGARAKLVKTFTTVHDEHTLASLQQLFTDAEGKDEVRAAALAAMPGTGDKNGYEIYLNTLTSAKALKVESLWPIFSPLRDSLAYTVANFNRVLPLIDIPEYRFNTLYLATDMVGDDEHPAYRTLVNTNIKKLTSYAAADLDTYLHADSTAKDDQQGTLFRYLNLMKEVKGITITDAFTAKLLNGSEWLQYNAAIARIRNHLPVKQTILNSLLDSLSTRYAIMEAYSKEKQLAKIPLKYATPAEFGRVCVYGYLEDEEDEGAPDKLSLLGSITYKGQVYYAYKFTMPEREEGKTYIAIVAPCKPGSTVLNFRGYNAYTDWKVQKSNWQLQAKQMIPGLIKQSKAAN